MVVLGQPGRPSFQVLPAFRLFSSNEQLAQALRLVASFAFPKGSNIHLFHCSKPLALLPGDTVPSINLQSPGFALPTATLTAVASTAVTISPATSLFLFTSFPAPRPISSPNTSMDEISYIPPGITPFHKSLLLSIPIDHASTVPAVRPCLELTKTCVTDLEELIKLCNENLPLLRTKPAVFRRTNTIISSARNQVSQVCQLLERMTTTAGGSGGRPGSSASSMYDDRGSVYSGLSGHGVGQGQGQGQVQISFKNRWGRLSTEARNLVNIHQPLMAKDQGAVLSELNFMRQTVLIAPTIANTAGGATGASTGGHSGQQPNRSKTTVWNNMGLLGEMLGSGGGGGGTSRSNTPQPQPPQQPAQRYDNTSSIPRPGFGGEYGLVLPPPYPGTPGLDSKPTASISPPPLYHSSSSLSLLSSNAPPRPLTNASGTTLWGSPSDSSFQELPGTGITRKPVADSSHTRSASNSASRTVFDSFGVGLLYEIGDSEAIPTTTKPPSTSTSELAGYGHGYGPSRSELPVPGAGPVTANTLIYHQHTHNHNYQCHHHQHGFNDTSNLSHDQTGGPAQPQQQLPKQYMVPAINEGKPQEMSSIVFEPDPVELP